MTTVSIREFQRNFYNYIDKLPLTITKHKKPVMVIKKADSSVKPMSKPEKKEIVFRGLCTHKAMLGLCKYGCR